MIQLDGTFGEGGGQIVRSALALSALTNKGFRIKNIRGGRSKPGLKAQHMAGIRALREICGSHTNEVEIGSTYLEFNPAEVKAGEYRVDIGTAGSITLLLQAVLPVLMFADGDSRIEIRGGTSGLGQPPIEYFQFVFAPYLQRFAEIEIDVKRLGYFPKGGGKVIVDVKPQFNSLREISGVEPYSLERGQEFCRIAGVSHASSKLEDREVAERQAAAAAEMLAQFAEDISIDAVYDDTASIGSGISIWIDSPNPLGASMLGRQGTPAEQIGHNVATDMIRWITDPAPVDEFLSDQLIPFLALLPGSAMRIPFASDHLLSNIHVVEQFLPVKFEIEDKVVRTSPRG